METTLYSTFLDDKDIACQVYEMLANDVLGTEQLEKIALRYHDMHRNFFNYSKNEAERLKKSEVRAVAWEFSKGLEPFKPQGWERCYEDTILVPVPITHPDFMDLTTRTEKRGAIGLDLPTWFNLKDNGNRIMIIAQDPLRGNMWYSDTDESVPEKKGDKENYVCTGALVSSPFGLHGKSWRDKKSGGGRMKQLVINLIEKGYGVYLTDCRKYFVYDKEESAKYSATKKEAYQAILQKEIEFVRPSCIVAMGNQAYDYCQDLIGYDERLVRVPHFSGLATKSQKAFFGMDKTQKATIEVLAGKYAEYIISKCKG